MQTPTQGRSPRFRVAKPLKGFAPLLFRECLRLSSCKRRMCPLVLGRTSPNALSHAWRIRSVLCRTKSAIFQGRPKCPLLADLFYGRWLTAISPCLFVSRVGFSPPFFYLRCWLTSATIRKWQLPIALQGGVLETHHDEHPM